MLEMDSSDFHLTAADQEELATALAEIRQGEYTDGRELLESIRSMTCNASND